MTRSVLYNRGSPKGTMVPLVRAICVPHNNSSEHFVVLIVVNKEQSKILEKIRQKQTMSLLNCRIKINVSS